MFSLHDLTSAVLCSLRVVKGKSFGLCLFFSVSPKLNENVGKYFSIMERTSTSSKAECFLFCVTFFSVYVTELFYCFYDLSSIIIVCLFELCAVCVFSSFPCLVIAISKNLPFITNLLVK